MAKASYPICLALSELLMVREHTSFGRTASKEDG